MKTIDPLFESVETFFVDYMKLLRGASQRTLASYRDSLRLLFDYASRARNTSIDRLRLAISTPTSSLRFFNTSNAIVITKCRLANCRLAALHSFFSHVLRRHPDQAARFEPDPRIAIEAAPPSTTSIPRSSDCAGTSSGAQRETASGQRDLRFDSLPLQHWRPCQRSHCRSAQGSVARPCCSPCRKRQEGTCLPFVARNRLKAIKAQIRSTQADPEKHLFQNARGHALSRHGAYRILGQQAEVAHNADARVPANISPHLLRHSCAVALLQAVVDLVTIRDQLGTRECRNYREIRNEHLTLKMCRSRSILGKLTA